MPRKKFEFSDEQINYILTNWGKESAHSMKEKFGCSWYAICDIAKQNNLEMPKSNEWSDEEIELLKELANKYSYHKIAKIMNKSENAIYLKARKLGITLIQDRRKWTKEEEQILSELWGEKSIEYIAKKLKRTVLSLKMKANKMQLGPMIKNNCELITVNDMTELLNVSRDRIINTWVNLGLQLKKVKLTKNKFYYAITWQNLMDFLKQNQNEWDSRVVEKNMLGPEPKWLQEKRKKDATENPLWYRKYTLKEIKNIELLFKRGKTYQEIATITERSQTSIANILRNLGYSYKLPKFWQGKELKYLRENYKNMTYKEIAEELGRSEKAVAANQTK